MKSSGKVGSGPMEKMIKFWWRSGSWIRIWSRIATLVRRALAEVRISSASSFNIDFPTIVFIYVPIYVSNVTAHNRQLVFLRENYTNYSRCFIKAKFHFAVVLASRSVTNSQAGSRPASELDEDLRAHVVCVSQANFVMLSSSLAVRRPTRDQIPLRCPACDQLVASLRPAREPVADLLASKTA